MLMYCEAAAQGGATVFTEGNVTLFGNPGDALLFSYKDDTSQLSRHMGCPVLSGEKLIITQWIREGVSRHHDHEGGVWDEPPFIPHNTHNLRCYQCDQLNPLKW